MRWYFLCSSASESPLSRVRLSSRLIAVRDQCFLTLTLLAEFLIRASAASPPFPPAQSLRAPDLPPSVVSSCRPPLPPAQPLLPAASARRQPRRRCQTRTTEQ